MSCEGHATEFVSTEWGVEWGEVIRLLEVRLLVENDFPVPTLCINNGETSSGQFW